jgi:hypothetical protein
MMKSLAIATATIAFSGAVLLADSAPVQAATAAAKNAEISVAARIHRNPSRVQASAVSRGVLLPYVIKKATAQRKAINNWNAKVRRMYGPQYASWNRAKAKSTTCNRVASAVTCRVSAIPTSNFRRYGMLND